MQKFSRRIYRLAVEKQTGQSGLRIDTRRWQEEGWKTKEDMARHTEGRFGHIGWLTGVTQEILPTIVPDEDLTRCPMFCSEWVGGTKSKQ